MDEHQELRFECKLCYKRYPCGKSLGGHMRSHAVANPAESDEKLEPNMKRSSSFVVAGLGGGGGGGVVGGGSGSGSVGGVGCGGPQGMMNNDSRYGELGNGQSSYGLRENPRKSWRAVDSTFPLPQEKICKQCGKGFHSMKALCGHMACHSEKDRSLKDDHSWTSENQKLVMDSHSDTEGEDRTIRTRSCKSKKFKKIVVNSPFSLASNNNGSSSASEIDGEEQEEVAICLMMLSRDSGNKGGVNSVVEFSDNNSVILETKSSSIDMKNGRKGAIKNKSMHELHETPQVKKIGDFDKSNAEIAEAENSDSGYFLDECAKAESDVSVDGIRRHNGVNEYEEYRQSLKRSKNYRAEVKRELAKENQYERIEQSRKRKYVSEGSDLCNEYEMVDKTSADPSSSSLKRSKYECFSCHKVFKSYQALGGHRPCHKKNTSLLYESRYGTGENSFDDSTELFAARGKLVVERKLSVNKNSCDKKSKAKKSKGHVCPFCNRVFKNGQALGGHKRSHFIGGHEVNNINNNNANTSNSAAAKIDLLDLNLPAPHEDDDDDDGNEKYSPWE